ncbi:Alpha/Beta hydrolase protein [Aspergillus pseudocaelatus]|uniref:Alpha/Beta hydrolase protein n=1 Tax=Aspergillus pseudocaelatus TaxID=1825620 RepID=A0ABQ6WMT2_9EURO|nr:Alpha/Beta hydrolase protein [Aspergillus pseudocaelatus]
MDFSEYTGPSEEWVALARELPPAPALSTEELKTVTNKGREDVSAKEMVEQGLQSKVSLRDHSIPTRDGATIQGRSYRPAGVDASQPLPIYIHLHGGGFLFGTLDSEDAACARLVATLAEQSVPIVVVNVNYRHAPEHKYPVAWNDTEDAFHWVHDHLSDIGGDGENLVIGGVSAGGWLTASTAIAQATGNDNSLAARPKIKGQVLIIPGLVHYDCYESQVKRLRDPSVSSWVQNRNAPVIPFERVQLFFDALGLRDAKGHDADLRLNPGNVSDEQVKGLPPATFGVAGMDPLRDEGLLFAQLLAENGVPTKTNVFKGVPHGFRRFGDRLSASKKWDETIVEGIKWALSNPAAGPFEIHAY